MKIFCIGIGGIGLSALARYYKSHGHTVLGSDMSESELTRTLKSEGINVLIGIDKKHIPKDADLVVYTAALASDYPELLQAKEFGIKTKTYFEALGEVTREKKTIAICGTHGKTTTTAMTYYAMKACGINPTVIVGSLLEGHNTNFIEGDLTPPNGGAGWMAVEACEYKRSFLNLHPAHIIVTNIDADHLDYYKDIDDIKSAFQSFVDKLDDNAFLATHSDVNLNSKATHLNADGIDLNKISLNVLGEHNKRNAQLVISLLTSLGLDEGKVREGLLDFRGTWRRLEYKGKTEGGVIVYDDYGHHPTEIRASLEALKEKYNQNKIFVFFQPHLYSRTKIFINDFAEELSKVDKVFVLPIYSAREISDGTIHESDLILKINELGGDAEFSELHEIKNKIESIKDNNVVVLNIGAGNAFEEINKIEFV